ncbi:MAG: hypothetical protein HKN70_07085 [Gammaproteobacteria bacterium]|nr:hypothetical protein [Gammaproteobacteria bacterium]
MNVVTKVLSMQMGLALLSAVVAGVLSGTVAAYSAVLGGMICVVPSAFLGARMMAVRNAPDPHVLLRAAYLGEAGKWLLSFILFVLVYVWIKPLNPVALLVGFMVAQGGIWAAILMDKQTLTG